MHFFKKVISEKMTDWNQRYAEADTPWDKGAPSPPLEELLENLQSSKWFGRGPILVPGCGAGHDVRALAAHAKGEVVGIDLAPLAIKKAESAAQHANENYELGSWFEFESTKYGQTAAIWEHTCFCAIDPTMRDTYVDTVRRLLEPGAYYFGVFFLETGSDNGPPWPSSLEELKKRFRKGFKLIYQQLPTRYYEGREGKEVVLGWQRCKEM